MEFIFHDNFCFSKHLDTMTNVTDRYSEYGKTNFCNIKYYFIKYVHSQMVLFGVAAKIGSKASKYSGSRTIIFSSSVTNTFVF